MSSTETTATVLGGVGIFAAIAAFAVYKLPIGPIGLFILSALPWTGMYGINLIAAGSFLPAFGKIIMHILFLILSKYVYIYGTVLFPQIATLMYIFSLLIYIDPWFVFDILIASSPKFRSGEGYFRLPVAFLGMKHNVGGLSKDGGINLIVFFAIIAALAYGGANILNLLPSAIKTPINSGISKVLEWTGFTALLGGGGTGLATMWTGIQTGNLDKFALNLPKWLGGSEGVLSTSSTVASDGVSVAAPGITPLTSSEAKNLFIREYTASLSGTGYVSVLNINTVPKISDLKSIKGDTPDQPIISINDKIKIQSFLPPIIEGINAAISETTGMENFQFAKDYLQLAKDVVAMNFVITATGAALAGGGIQQFAHTMLSTSAPPTLSTIMKGLNTPPPQQGGGSAKKEDSVDDSLFLSILGFITLGGMVTAVLRSVPNRQSS